MRVLYTKALGATLALVGIHTLVLLRHGEYDTSDVGTFGLTARGRRQAELAGAALAGGAIERVVSSTMVRARETAEIVCGKLGATPKATPLLAEGMPTRLKSSKVSEAEVRADLVRLSEAYGKYFRPLPRARTDLLVCHANVIRYFVTRALGIRVAAWTRLVANHCSITRILVLPSGATRLVSYNETGHLTPDTLT